MSERSSNRAAFPETAKLVDELRGVFGPGVKLVWAEESGLTIGEKGPAGVVATLVHAPDDIKQSGRRGA